MEHGNCQYFQGMNHSDAGFSKPAMFAGLPKGTNHRESSPLDSKGARGASCSFYTMPTNVQRASDFTMALRRPRTLLCRCLSHEKTQFSHHSLGGNHPSLKWLL